MIGGTNLGSELLPEFLWGVLLALPTRVRCHVTHLYVFGFTFQLFPSTLLCILVEFHPTAGTAAETIHRADRVAISRSNDVLFYPRGFVVCFIVVDDHFAGFHISLELGGFLTWLAVLLRASTFKNRC